MAIFIANSFTHTLLKLEFGAKHGSTDPAEAIFEPEEPK